MDWNIIKEGIGRYAIDYLLPQKGLIGLGSGTTSNSFIRALGTSIDYRDLKKNIRCIATSEDSFTLASSLNIPLIADSNWHEIIVMTFDGADYIDPLSGLAIKGLGGALLREKIVAATSERVVFMVDERKIIHTDKKIPLTIPVEIAQFGSAMTLLALTKAIRANFDARSKLSFRKNPLSCAMKESYFITDNGNYTVDIPIEIEVKHLSALDSLLKNIPGVLETGIFINLATEILIGYSNGDIQYHSLNDK